MTIKKETKKRSSHFVIFVQVVVCFIMVAFWPKVGKSTSANDLYLIKKYQQNDYEDLLNYLPFEQRSYYDEWQLYLLYKILVNNQEYEKAKIVLEVLEEKVDPYFKPVIVSEEIDLYLQKGDKKSLLDLLIRSVDKDTNHFLEEQIEKILVENFNEFDDKPLLKRCIEKLAPPYRSFHKNSDIIKLYFDSLAKNDPNRRNVQIAIWEFSDISETSDSDKYIVKYVKRHIGTYQEAVLNHFKTQKYYKNYRYIIKEIPTYLSLLGSFDPNIHESLRDIYFYSLKRNKQYSQAINLLKTEKKRDALKLSIADALSIKFSFWLSKDEPKEAIAIIHRLKKLGESIDLRDKYYAVANYYYYKGQYSNSLLFFNQLQYSEIEKEEVAPIQWKLFRIHHTLKNIKDLTKIAQWAAEYQFESDEMAARFCYWGYKLQLYQQGSMMQCYEDFPLTYYGLHSEEQLKKEQKTIKTKTSSSLISLVKTEGSLKEKRFLNFLELLYQLDNTKLADSIAKLYFNKNNEISVFVRLADSLIRARRYYLLQTILDTHYRAELPSSLLNRELLLPYFYPAAFKSRVKTLSQKTSVPEMLVFSVMREESHFRTEVESVAGAVGLMQLMPQTAKYIGKTIGLKVNLENLVEPELNLKLGTTYLKRLLKRYKGNKFYTLAAYNGGPTNVKRWIKRAKSKDIDYFVESITFNETQNYVRRVMRSFYIYQKLYGKAL